MKQEPKASRLEVSGDIQAGRIVFDRDQLLSDRVAGNRAFQILRSLAEVVGQLDEASGTFRLIVAASANGRLHNSSLSLELCGSNGSAADSVSLPWDSLGLSSRASRVLTGLQVKTLGEIAALTEQQLRVPRECGDVTVDEIRYLLKDFGLSLSTETT
jgi:DNA-directed RNA polymerase alpha subunit